MKLCTSLFSLFIWFFSAVYSDTPGKTLLTHLEDVTTQANSIGKHMLHDQRRLQILTFTCQGEGSQHFFTISIELIPQGGYNTSNCTSELQKAIGIDLNSLLMDYGLGDAGEGDGAAYVALVCTNPTKIGRRLQQLRYTWRGGGTCRKCASDNFDTRRLYDQNWFKNIYVPEMQNTLRNAITKTVVTRHITCLGKGPRVNVIIKEVATASQVPTVCN
jgi:hypothetical protein